MLSRASCIQSIYQYPEYVRVMLIRVFDAIFSMSIETSFLTPLATQLGVGGILGLVVGFALKKIAKIAAAILGLLSLGLIYMESQGLIAVDWLGVGAWGNTALAVLGQAEGALGVFLSNLPIAGGGLVGFSLGMKWGGHIHFTRTFFIKYPQTNHAEGMVIDV